MKNNKILTGLFLILVGFVLLVGCTSGGEETGSTSNSDSASENQTSSSNDSNSNDTANKEAGSGKLFDEPKTFTMFNNAHPSWPYSEDQPVRSWIKEKTNVTIDMTAVEGSSFTDQYNLTIASRDLQDIFWQIGFERANKFGGQGAFVNMEEYKDIMPNMFKMFEENPDVKKAALSADGALYTAPSMNTGVTNRMIWLYREDVFKKHNLKAPTTWDELYDVSKKLKELYPDSYPFVFRGNFARFRWFAPTFGISYRYYHDENGKYQFGPVQDEYKMIVEYLRKFYEEGLIQPTWLTDQTKEWQEYVANSQGFITPDYIGRIDFFNNMVRPNNPEFSMIFMPPPAGFDGAPRHNPDATLVPNGMSVSTTAEDIEGALKYIDWFYSEEGQELASWGKKGELFTEPGGELIDKYAGKEFNTIRKETGHFTNGAYLAVHENLSMVELASEELKYAIGEAPKYDAPLQVLPPLTEEEQQEAALLGEAIDKAYEENISKFIIGERSLDEWDQYVQEINNLGLSKLLEIYQTAYDRINK